MKIKPYPKYKESGVQWIGEIPEEWKTNKLKHNFLSLSKSSLEASEGNDEGKFPFFTSSKNQDKFIDKAIFDDDCLILGTGGVACVHHVKGQFSVSTDCLTLKKEKKENNMRFLYYQVLSEIDVIDELGFWGMGLRHLQKYFFYNMLSYIPKIEEQNSIVNFLDSKISQLDQTIEKLKKLKKLLKYKRLSLISQAILDENLPKLRLQHLVNNIYRPIIRRNKEIYTPLGLYNWARGIFHKTPTEGEELGDSNFYYIKEGDLILSGQFAWEGAVAIAGNKEEGCIVSHRYPILRGKKGKVTTEYLWAFFTSKEGDFILNECSIGSAGRNRPLNINRLMKEKIRVPPFELQEKVSGVIKKEKELDKLYKKFTQLMEEYKKSLIHHVVTGKVDVRETVA